MYLRKSHEISYAAGSPLTYCTQTRELTYPSWGIVNLRNFTFCITFCISSKVFSNGLVTIRAHQFFEQLLFVFVTENLLGKLYVMVGVQMHYCDMQIAICGLLRKSRLEMAIFFHLRFQMRSFGSTKKNQTGLGNIVILLSLFWYIFFLTEGAWTYKCLDILFPFSQLSFDWRLSHNFCSCHNWLYVCTSSELSRLCLETPSLHKDSNWTNRIIFFNRKFLLNLLWKLLMSVFSVYHNFLCAWFLS